LHLSRFGIVVVAILCVYCFICFGTWAAGLPCTAYMCVCVYLHVCARLQPPQCLLRESSIWPAERAKRASQAYT